MELRITSYNCCSIRKRVDPIKEILENNDFLLCQEILLLEEDCNILRQIDEDFEVFYVPSKNPQNLGDGRPIAGLATFYRKSLQMVVELVCKTDNFLILSVKVGSYVFYLANIYLPCDDRSLDAVARYQGVLGELQSFLDDTECSNVVLFGDFNVVYNSERRFWPDLERFIIYNQLTMNDLLLPNDTFTYLNTAHNSTTWIDHILSSSAMNISNIVVHYEAALYDHFPISLQLSIPEATSHVNKINKGNSYHDVCGIRWELFKKNAVVIDYNNRIIENMRDTNLCLNLNCPGDHKQQIDNFYENLVNYMKLATKFAERRKNKKFQPIPGWNDICRQKFREARDSFLRWVAEGKIRSGAIYEDMNRTRKSFKNSLKFCKYYEEQIKIEKLAGNMLKKKPNVFWREVGNRTGKFQSHISDCIDGLKNPQDIANHFAVKFKAVNGASDNICYDVPTCDNNFYDPLRISHITSAISCIKTGVDCDGLHANHFKYLTHDVKLLIKNFFNACFIHNHFPLNLMKGVIKPRAKNKFGNMKDSSNYREVMHSTMHMKLLEYLLLPHLNDHCKISRSQYGYRSNTSTSLAISTLKEVIKTYTDQGSTIYACFLDLSKAFERINHSLLLQKLHETTLPKHIINAIEIMLSSGSVKVNSHGCFSQEWNIAKGARQGGVLSALLFNIYVDSILQEMLRQDHGCFLGITKINSQAYADDFVIFCPSAGGLRTLLQKFGIMARQHCLEINSSKTKIIIFHKKRACHSDVYFEINGSKIELVKSYKYLGTIITFNLKENEDIMRLQASFNRKVGMTLRKFHAAELDVKMRLFKTLCMDMYGIELWGDILGCANLLKQIGVSYHYALKRILGLSKRDSNHYACYLLDQLTFENMRMLKTLQYYRWLKNCSSPCVTANKFYFMNNSAIKHRIDQMFYEKYQIENIDDNDIDAIISRMKFVQYREESSWQMDVLSLF